MGERYYAGDLQSFDKFPVNRKERYYVEDLHSFDKFPVDRKERYYFEDGHSFDESFHKKDAVNAHIDWKETSDAYVFRIELPAGVKRDEVKLEVEENGVLCISGEIRAEKEEKSEMWRRVERSSEKFYQRISLPDGADVDHVKADINNGVLAVTVPKHHFKKAIARTVQISGH